MPVRAVVLFSSGVGYFEHFGNVAGNGSTELRFKTEQINDVLKSLVLQDMDGGQAGTVSYPSQEPIERTLKSFQVDITGNPTLHDLLNQLRGARLSVTLEGNSLTGVIMGVEKRTHAIDEKKTEERHLLTLKVDRKVRRVPLDDVQEMSFEDAALDAELDKALSALSESRDRDKKPVTINFRGEGRTRCSTPTMVPLISCPADVTLSRAPRSWLSKSASDGLLVTSTWKLLSVRSSGSWLG